MAWKNRQRRANDSDIIDAEDWNENMREFANEFNGFLDRDNIAQNEIGSEHLEGGTFNRVFYKKKSSLFVLTGESAKSAGSLATYEPILNNNGMLICELSGHFQFDNPPSFGTLQPSYGQQIVTIRLLVDNEEVGRAHAVADFSMRHSFYICGAIPVEAGFHRVTAEAKTAIADNEHGGNQMIASFQGNSRTVTFGNRELVLTFRRR